MKWLFAKFKKDKPGITLHARWGDPSWVSIQFNAWRRVHCNYFHERVNKFMIRKWIQP